MAATILELHGSRTFSVDTTGGTAKFLYYIGGEPDEAAAYDLVLANSPATWYGYTRSTIDMNERPTLNQWWPVVNYTIPVGQPTNTPPMGDGPGGATPPASSGAPANNATIDNLSFSITTESQHVQRSLSTISRTGLGGSPAPDAKNLIGVTQDGKVEGVDILVPVATLQLKSTIPYLTVGYFKNLLWVCGSTNQYPWWIAKEEEMLFTGASGQQKGSGEMEVNYEFKYIKTKTNITIRSDSGELVVAEKRGHHYLWTMNRLEKDATANVMVERPYAAYVEKVYDSKPFEWLGVF